MQRLGKNIGGYRGETVDIRAILHDVKAAAQQHGWACEVFHQVGDLEMIALHRVPAQTPAHRVYISSGIHGDEPAGPLVCLRLLRENRWPDSAEIFLLPCLNPAGFVLNTRENYSRVDLNRDYRHLESAEIAAHVRWLQLQPGFDLTLCLHEDWESHGFYLYELNPDQRPSLAVGMTRAVAAVCPIDPSPVIEGREARDGIISPNLDPASRPMWPEAFWLIQNKTRQSYTLEAPSDFPLAARVDATVAAVYSALEQFCQTP